jgi:hypothetical protein
LLDEPLDLNSLRRFTGLLIAGTSLIMLVFAATPLSQLWFERFSGLAPQLATIAAVGVWISLPMPGLSVLQSWYQGLILHDQRTRGITEAVIVFLVTCTLLLWAGVAWGGMTGLYVALGAFVTAMLTQTIWLWFRSRPAEQLVVERDQAELPLQSFKAASD